VASVLLSREDGVNLEVQNSITSSTLEIVHTSGCFNTYLLLFIMEEQGQLLVGCYMENQQQLFLSLASRSSMNLQTGLDFLLIFLSSQQFWGNMVAVAGAGAKPIPHKSLTAENLAEAISYCLTPQALAAAQEISTRMRSESGVRTAVNSFHANLPIERLSCNLLPDQPAAWTYKRKQKPIKLSKVAMELLSDHLKLDRNKVDL
jgi:hypothetical protein